MTTKDNINVSYVDGKRAVYLTETGDISMLKAVANELGAAISDPYDVLSNHAQQFAEIRLSRAKERLNDSEAMLNRHRSLFGNERNRVIENDEDIVRNGRQHLEESERELRKIRQDPQYAVSKVLDGTIYSIQ